MKPIHLNLSSRPYRDYRPVIAVVVVMALLTAFLTLNNVDTYLRYRTETKTTRANIAKLEKQIEDERRRTDSLNQQLPRTGDLKLLAMQTQFANSRLAERAFSWSELLDRLERVLPDDVRIQSIAPSFDKSGMVHLMMICDGKTTDSLVATLNRFNRDTNFANAFPTNEEHNDAGGYRFSIGVDYRPSIARPVE